MSSRFDFSSLPDLRAMDRGHDTLIIHLECQAPSPFNHYAVGPFSGNGMSVLVYAIRHLYTFIKPIWQGLVVRGCDAVESAITRDIQDVQEVKNPLLRFAWSSLESDRASLASQNYLLEAIAKELRYGDSRLPNLSFLSLMESPLMLQTLLKREAFQLYDRNAMAQPIQGEALGEDWFAGDGQKDPVSMAKKSLITWRGQGDLGEIISDKFGIFESAPEKMRYFFSFNQPAIIRVHYYTPKWNVPVFAALKQIRVSGKRMRSGEGNLKRIPSAEEGSILYSLVLVVRLGRGGRDTDLIRRYNINGEEIFSPTTYPHSNPNWTVKEPNRQFMLFYSESPKMRIGFTIPEVGYEPTSSTENYRDAGRWVEIDLDAEKKEQEEGRG